MGMFGPKNFRKPKDSRLVSLTDKAEETPLVIEARKPNKEWFVRTRTEEEPSCCAFAVPPGKQPRSLLLPVSFARNLFLPRHYDDADCKSGSEDTYTTQQRSGGRERATAKRRSRRGASDGRNCGFLRFAQFVPLFYFLRRKYTTQLNRHITQLLQSVISTGVV